MTLPKCCVKFALLCLFGLFSVGLTAAKGNVPGGIVSGTSANVTLVDNGSTVTLDNGIAHLVVTKSDASMHTINYTYNNGAATVTDPLLAQGNGGGGGMLYWTGNPASFGTMNFVYSLVANTGTYAEISLVSTSASNGVMEIHYSMLKGSPGFYCTPILTHRAIDTDVGIVMRPNIYAGLQFNWMSVDATRNKLMEVPSGSTAVVPTSPVEDYLWTSGIYQGLYEDKYKYTANLDGTPAWGWSSVGTSGSNVGIWNITASPEYYPGGPLERSLMEHIGTTILNVFTGGYFGLATDNDVTAGEVWTKTYGPYFYYFNNVPKSVTDPIQVSQTLYADALAQAAAEKTAWPYTWFNNANYKQASARGTVTGKIVISDSGNPTASAAGLWVGVTQQPATSAINSYDFQEWCKTYQYWVKTDGSGNFSIPSVISGTGYTLYAFGTGANGQFMSQNQTGGNPPNTFNLPASPFSVTVVGGSTTNLGTLTWTPTRVGPTVWEIGYPDRTAAKFRHGEDWFVGDIGPSKTSPSSVWTKFLEWPFDFPNGLTYNVGTSRWSTDWNFIQPVTLTTAGSWNATSSNITFKLPAGTSLSGSASLYLGLASDYDAAIIVTINNKNISSITGFKGSPVTSIPSTGYLAQYQKSDGSIREGNNGAFCDERITFPASALVTGTSVNTINVGMRQVGGVYFANHFMYDYIRLELAGYVPPAPPSVTGFPGNNRALVTWPVQPGATSYNVLRSVTSGTGYGSVASGVTGPVCGSGSSSAAYVDTTATNGTTYFYVVQSVNPQGTSTNSVQSSGVTPSTSAATSAPTVPTGVTATGTSGSVTVNWTASTGASYYTVFRSTLVQNGTAPNYNTLNNIVLTNTATGTSYTDPTITNGSTYFYTLMANNAVGTSGTVATSTVRPLASGSIAAPATVTATPGTQQVTLNWSAVPGATGYVVSVATTPGGPYTFLVSVDYLTYTDGGNSDNTKYYYVINANNSGAVSANSTEVSATTAPAPPTGVTASIGNTQTTLNWSAATAATSYAISRATVSGGPYTVVGTSAGRTFTDNGLTNGTTYYYVVQSTNANGTGVDSAEANVTPSATVPVAPLGLTATASVKKVTLNWSPSASATSYTVYTGSNSGGPYSLVAAGLTGTNYANTGLKDNTTYYYVVTASGTGGASSNSAEVNATTPASSTTLLTWDNLGANFANPADGSGNWNTTSSLWSTGTSDIAWNNGLDYAAVFGNNNGSAGTVTVGNITTDEIVFNSAANGSYTLTSGTITMSGTISTLTANANATIGSVLASTGTVTMNGAGTITLTTPATFTAPVNLTNITLDLQGPSASASMLGTGTLNMNGATLTHLTGGSSTSDFSNPINVGAGLSGSVIFSSRTAWGTVAVNPAVTGSGALNLIINSTLSGTPDDVYANFGSFAGQVNIVGGTANAGMRYFLGTSATGSTTATWNIGGTGTKVQFSPQSGGSNVMNMGGLTGGSVATLNGGSSALATYSIGANGASNTFGGAITGNAGILKVGGGTQILSGSYSYTGSTVVNAGVLEITGTMLGTSGLTVGSGAELFLNGGSLSVSGGITNSGTFKIAGSAALGLAGTFTNNGVLDLINGGTLPASFVNNGVVLDSSTVKVQQVALSGSNCTITLAGYTGHSYQLESSPALTSGSWTDVGPAQTGTNGTLTFTDSGGATGTQKFYRVEVTATP